MRKVLQKAGASVVRRPLGRKHFPFAALASALISLHACTAHAEDLLTVYRKAQTRDAVLEAARYQALAAAEKIPQARAALLPGLSLSSNTSRQKGDAAFAGAPPIYRNVLNNGTTLQLNQPLVRWSSWVALDQADAQVRQSMAQYAQARQDLILRVCQKYFDVIVAQEGVAVALGQLKAVGQQLELARRNFDVGMATVTDVHEAKSRFDLSRSQRISANTELENKRVELQRVLGDMPGALAPLKADANLPGVRAEERDAMLTRATTTSPLVQIQEAAEAVAAKEIDRNTAAHLPTLDFTASYGKTYTSGSISSPADISVRNHIGQVGLQLNVPLSSGGGISSRVREAIANLGKARADLEDARRQSAALVQQAYSGVVNGQAQTEALLSAVESSKSSVEANQMGYKIGTRINIDVLNAEQQLYAARRDLAKSKVDTLMSGLRLKAAMGTLDVDDVEAANALLQAPEQ